MDIKKQEHGSSPADSSAADAPGGSFADVRNARVKERASERASERAARPPEREETIGRVQTARRRHRAGNYMIYYVLLGMILTIVFVTLSMTVFFNINTINVSGSEVYSSDQILASVDAKSGDNLLRLNTEKIAKNALARLTAADSVDVTRHFPDQLDVSVTDGVPALQVSMNGQFYRFTEKGRLIAVSDTAAVDAPIVVGPDPSALSVGQYMDSLSSEAQATFSVWKTVWDVLYNYSIADISAMDLSDEINIRLYYQNRIEIRVGTLTEMDEKIATLKAVLYESGSIGVDETGSIDLTNPDRVYFNNQSSVSLPAGAGQPGWNWFDPHSDTLEQSLYAPAEDVSDSDSTDGTDASDGASDPSVSTDADGNFVGSADGSSDAETGDSSDSTSDAPSYDTSDGMRLPQLPSISGGHSGGSGSSSSGNTAAGSTSPSVPSISGSASDTASSAPSSESASSTVGVVGAAGNTSGSTSGSTSGAGMTTGSGFGTQAPAVPSIGG